MHKNEEMFFGRSECFICIYTRLLLFGRIDKQTTGVLFPKYSFLYTMKKITSLTFILLFAGLLVNAQSPFADNCIGTWKGVMYISKNGIVKDSVSVRLTVGKHKDAAAWSWKTEYLSEKMPVTKDYVLRLKDAEKNIYATDEGGGNRIAGLFVRK
jgi:hypothetical protein